MMENNITLLDKIAGQINELHNDRLKEDGYAEARIAQEIFAYSGVNLLLIHWGYNPLNVPPGSLRESARATVKAALEMEIDES